MRVYTKRELAKIAGLMMQGMEEAGFTGIKIDRADMPQASFDNLMQEDKEAGEDLPSIADFSSEVCYYRVATDQGSFGFWLQPYPTLDLTGTGLDIKTFMPSGQDLSGLPPDWCFIGMDEDIFKQLFEAFAKKSGQP